MLWEGAAPVGETDSRSVGQRLRQVILERGSHAEIRSRQPGKGGYWLTGHCLQGEGCPVRWRAFVATSESGSLRQGSIRLKQFGMHEHHGVMDSGRVFPALQQLAVARLLASTSRLFPKNEWSQHLSLQVFLSKRILQIDSSAIGFTVRTTRAACRCLAPRPTSRL